MPSYRTLRRIQVIVALMMILSMLVGSPAAQAKVYDPRLPTAPTSPAGAHSEDSAGPVISRNNNLTVTFANPVSAGQTVLGVKIQVRGQRTGSRTTTTVIRSADGDALTDDDDTWTSSWETHEYTSTEGDDLLEYVQGEAGESQIVFQVRNVSSSSNASDRQIRIDWVKLIVTTAEPTVAPPEIVGSCAPANIHLVVDNSGSIGTGNLNTLKTNLKSFMLAVETAVPGTNWNVTKFSGSSASSSGWATSDLTSVNNFVDGMSSSSYTPTARGIQQARNQPIPSGSGALPKIMIILTDGAPNRRLSDTSGRTRYYYQGAADAIAQADLARGDGWTTFLVAIGSGDSDAPAAPYAANVNLGLAGSAANVMSTDFEVIRTDLLNRLASGCAIDLEKEVDQDVVLPGTEVTYTYTVSNPMSVNLTNITLADDKCSPLSGPTGTGSGDGVLNPGEIWQYTCSQTIAVDTLNTAVVTGTVASVGTFNDTDTATVTVIEPGPGSIAAWKFLDSDKDGLWDAGEPAIGGWQSLCLDGNSCQTTASNGFATWSSVATGSHMVSETLPVGWGTLSVPQPYNVQLGTSTWGPLGVVSTTLTVPGTSDSYRIEFVGRTGNTWTYRVSEVSGKDLSHWVLGLGACQGMISSTSPTASDIGKDGSTGFTGAKWNLGGGFTSGQFSITLNGNYPEGTVQVLAKTGSGTAMGQIAGPICTIFGNYPDTYSISGAKYHDLDGDGVWDTPSESGLSGWVIELEDAEGTVITTTTVAGGSYSFDDLVAGTYTVTEVLQTGWQQTAPAGGKYVITLPDDAVEGSVTGKNFGNQQFGDLEVVKVVDWNGVTPDSSQTFTFTITGPSFPAPGDSKTVSAPGWTASWSGLIPGTYTVTETSPGSEWTVTGSPRTLSVTGGLTATATITNARKLGSLDVVKVVDWNGVVANTSQVFTITITGPSFPSGDSKPVDYDGGTASWSGLIPGDYSVTETGAGSEWTVTGSGVTVTVPINGGSASTTITNTRKLGGLDVVKVVDWNGVTPDSSQTFTFTITGPSFPAGNSKTVSAPGWTASWSGLVPGDYTVTESGAGSEWTVTGSGAIVSVPVGGGSASTTITNTRVPDPAIDLTKVANPTATDPGATVDYTLYYTNTGNIALTGVTLVDDPDETYVASIDASASGGTYAAGQITWTIGDLAIGASGSVTYQATLKDDAAFDPGSTNVDNTATIDSNETGPVDDDATVTVTLLALPSLSLVKEIGTSSTGPWQEHVTVFAGASVYYRFTITNTGNITVTNLAIVDPNVDVTGAGCPTVLGRGASGSCVVGPETAVAGTLVNTAQATGLLPDATPISSNQDTASYLGLDPSIVVVKTANPTSVYPGDTVTYDYVVTNTGTITLTNIVLTDDKLGPITLTVSTLGPGASTTGTMTYTVQVGDVSPIVNTATVTGTATVGSDSRDVTDQDDATVNVILPASLTIIKDAAGDTTAEFGFTLDEEQLALSVLPRDGALPVSFTLKGGESETFALEPGRWYNVTETSMPDGWVLVGIDCNWAQAGSISQIADPNSTGGWLSEGQSVTCTFYNRLPGLDIVKSVEPANAEPGETVVYTIAYSNTGTLDLTGVSITDDPDETYVAGVANISNGGLYDGDEIVWIIGNLAAGAGGTLSYEVTLKDEDAFALGQTPVDNVAVIDSNETDSKQDDATVIVTRLLQPVPGLSIDKVGSVTTAHIGDTVAYTITVQNTGNITLTNVTVVDAKLGINQNLGSLAVGESAQVTGSYLVTEADLGGIVNTAIADSDQTDPPVDDTWTVEVITGPAIAIEKVGSVTSAHIGDTVAYTITVTNIGDVTLTNVTVVDAKLGINENVGDLTVGASKQVTGSYLVTEADLGGIVNTAVADSDQTDPVDDTWTVEVVSGPALAIEKVGSTTVAKPGDTVAYTITVTNIGDVTLTNVTVVDAKLGINQNVGDLAPGASAQVTGSYLVTAADLGGIVNTAVADSDQTDPVDDTWTVEVTSQPGIVLEKSVNTAIAAVGDVVTYTLKVTNNGNVPLTDVTIVDPILDINVNIGDLAVGESASIEVPYTIPEGAPDQIVNVATATGQDPSGQTVSDEDDAVVTVRRYEQPPTPVPCIRADVAVVIFGGWNDIPVKAWVGGTEQQTLYTAIDSFGQQQVMWTFYPPENTSWNVAVQPQTPEGLDPARWQYKLVRIESPSQGTENNSPGSASVSIRRCNQYVLYFQLMDNGVTPPVAPTPPSEPRLPVTGGGPEPIVAGGLGLFAALSGLGWSIRRRR